MRHTVRGHQPVSLHWCDQFWCSRHALPAKQAAKFADHCERHVLPLLRANVFAGRAQWTNNNCESINHVLNKCRNWSAWSVSLSVANTLRLIARFTDLETWCWLLNTPSISPPPTAGSRWWPVSGKGQQGVLSADAASVVSVNGRQSAGTDDVMRWQDTATAPAQTPACREVRNYGTL